MPWVRVRDGDGGRFCGEGVVDSWRQDILCSKVAVSRGRQIKFKHVVVLVTLTITLNVGFFVSRGTLLTRTSHSCIQWPISFQFHGLLLHSKSSCTAATPKIFFWAVN